MKPTIIFYIPYIVMDVGLNQLISVKHNCLILHLVQRTEDITGVVGPGGEGVQVEHDHTVSVDSHHAGYHTQDVQQKPNLKMSLEIKLTCFVFIIYPHHSCCCHP